MSTPAALRAERLAAHGIGAQAGRSAADRLAAPSAIVRRMTALQGQDLAQTLWAVGVRGVGLSRQDVTGAFDRGELVRSWPMRGTLHTLDPDDLRLLLSLTGSRTIRSIGTRLAQRGVDDGVVDVARRSVIDLLTAERTAPRDRVLAHWRTAGIDPSDGSGYDLLLRLALEGARRLGTDGANGAGARAPRRLVTGAATGPGS